MLAGTVYGVTSTKDLVQQSPSERHEVAMEIDFGILYNRWVGTSPLNTPLFTSAELLFH